MSIFETSKMYWFSRKKKIKITPFFGDIKFKIEKDVFPKIPGKCENIHNEFLSISWKLTPFWCFKKLTFGTCKKTGVFEYLLKKRKGTTLVFKIFN